MSRFPRAPHRLLVLLALAAASAPSLAQEARPARGGLTAYRPQSGAGTFPFARTRVPEALEEDPLRGPGIRRNGAGEVDPAGEDDLIEVTATRGIANATYVLERGAPELSVWTTRTKVPGTQVAFSGNLSAPLAFGGARTLTLWAEWTGTAPGTVTLDLGTLESGTVADRLVFHVFRGLVVALGGEGQVPGLPLDPNHGTFLAATTFYEDGYDVLMRDEDEVLPDGSGPVYAEVVNAIQHRGVDRLAIYGYSHGAGSTYDLCDRLDLFAGTIGAFTVEFTSYVDSVQNDSDVDVDMELRRPIGSAWHANHYQHGTFFDAFLDGGPVNASEPPPSGLDVETTPWGAGATHFLVDDYVQVLDFLVTGLEARLDR